VRVLRTGADELITRPLDLDEMMLRVGRLTRSSAVGGMAFEGRLESHPMREVVRFIERAEKPGELIVWGRAGSGRLRLDESGGLSAEWERHAGDEALLAIVGLKKGRFRFVAESDGEVATADGVGVRLERALMEAAWIEEELEKRREALPPSGRSLELVAGPVPLPSGRFAPLPVTEVAEALRERGSARLFDLVAMIDTAPQKVGLAVAWLCERGAVRVAARDEDFPTTVEIAAAEVLDAAVDELALAARAAGSRANPVPYLLLAEEGAWEELAAIVAGAPPSWRPESVTELGEKLRERGGGSATVDTDAGSVTLHLRRLSESARGRIEAIAPVCAGVLLWLGDGGSVEPARALIARVEAGAGCHRAVLIAPGERGGERAEELLGGGDGWLRVPHAPRSLLGVLRLLIPDTEI
jgi:hypothetical protein